VPATYKRRITQKRAKGRWKLKGFITPSVPFAERWIITMKKDYYKIDEVAKRTGLTKRCIRYYEDIGLVVPKRTACSYRLYTDEDLENIKIIKNLKDNLGFSLKEVKNFLILRTCIMNMFKNNNTSNIEEYIEQIKSQIDFINKKQETLNRVKDWSFQVFEKLEELKLK
jgi:DNA-binding transcriptional MerR regulator